MTLVSPGLERVATVTPVRCGVTVFIRVSLEVV